MNLKDLTDAHIAYQLFAGYSEHDKQLLIEFESNDVRPEPGFVVDFIGARMRTSSLWKGARVLDGRRTGLPDPCDFHAEAVEWIGVLKAVRSARNQYVSLELGAGFGPWSIAGGLAARKRSIGDIRLYAVEADPHHFRFLRQHFIDNGFEPDIKRLIEAAVGSHTGEAQWPTVTEESAAEESGCRPMMSETDYRGRHYEQTKRVRVIALRDLLKCEAVWDLIHIDVQGSEVEICSSCIDVLGERARWIVAATHSRKLDGDFMSLMYYAGWALEHEKPSRFTFAPAAASLEAMTTVDGTQVWRNSRLTTIQLDACLTSFAHEITSPAARLRLGCEETYVLPIDVKNTGTQTWFGGQQSMSVAAGYRWFDREGNLMPIEGNRALLSRPAIGPGETDSLELRIVAPQRPGLYNLRVSMVQEGVAWFYQHGARALVLTVEVH